MTSDKKDDKELFELLHPAVRDYFYKELKHTQLTLVQQCTIKKMLENFDCIVQAPTGSGKSLAYILPTMHIMTERRSKSIENDDGCQILALIVAPSRELINQLHSLFSPICKTLNFKTIKLFGAGGHNKKLTKIGIKNFKGQCILIATPGRVESFLAKEPILKNYLKYLEVLVVDEADRYSDQESRRSLATLLSILPKQRRTALFSATQPTAIEDLLKFGLRNPFRLLLDLTGAGKVEMKMEEAIEISGEENGRAEGGLVTPKELINYYAIVPAECKFLAMLKLLKSQKAEKILVFVSNAAQSEYFSLIVPPLLGDEKRLFLSLHRKMANKRQQILDQFRSTERSILFATDILARGVDVVDIDWVLQFDIPKLSSLFVHRNGRSGRMGRDGKSLLLLTEEESAYVDFIQKHENVALKESEFEGLTSKKMENIQQKIQQMAINDRKILELGSSAFVSFIEAYSRHDCQIVCKVKGLNISGLANAFGLLRLPRIRELIGRKDIAEFKPRMDIRTSQIKFQNNKLEAKRQMKLVKNFEKKNEIKIEAKEGDSRGGAYENNDKEKRSKKRPKMSEWEQLQKEENLIKKFKKGNLTKEELDYELDEL